MDVEIPILHVDPGGRNLIDRLTYFFDEASGTGFGPILGHHHGEADHAAFSVFFIGDFENRDVELFLELLAERVELATFQLELGIVVEIEDETSGADPHDLSLARRREGGKRHCSHGSFTK